MPRGVYDRTKTKAQREAEKKTAGAHAAPAKAKGKPGRKPGSGKVTKSAAPTKTAEAKVSYGGEALNLFATVRANIETLTLVADKFGPTAVPGVVSEIGAHVEIMTNLRKQTFGTNEAKTDSTETVAEATPEASNGTAQAAAPQYPSTVPMPPAPIPSIPPATH